MPINYSVRFQPGRFHVVPAVSSGSAGTHTYYNIVDDKSGRQVAFSVDDNDAKSVCLALELMSSMLEDDRTRSRELVKLVEDLRKGTVQ